MHGNFSAFEAFDSRVEHVVFLRFREIDVAARLSCERARPGVLRFFTVEREDDGEDVNEGQEGVPSKARLYSSATETGAAALQIGRPTTA